MVILPVIFLTITINSTINIISNSNGDSAISIYTHININGNSDRMGNNAPVVGAN